MHRPAGRRQALAWPLYASLLLALLHGGRGTANPRASPALI
ncbi:hypothetical protein [Pseudomonas aegrilactucae]|nr:hypothetical protein [Pseudomonas aegrilactucae]